MVRGHDGPNRRVLMPHRTTTTGAAPGEDRVETCVTGHGAQPAPYAGKGVIGDPAPTGQVPGTPGAAHQAAASQQPGPRARRDLEGHVPYRSPRPLLPVRLDTNESPYPPCGALRADLAALAGAHHWHRYGDLDALRERLAGLHDRPVARVWVAAGVFELLVQLLRAFGGVGRTVWVPEPCWGGYRHVAAATGTKVVDGTAADVLVICSPSNPTGHTALTQTIARTCAANPTSLVVVDEAYAEFSSQPTAAGLLDRSPNLVVVRTFSKALALADLRLTLTNQASRK